MPNETILAAAEGLPKLSRRTLLGAVTAIIPAAATPAKMKAFDWDAFFAEATPAQLASFHAKALTEAMAKLHPGLSWRHVIDHKVQFVLVVGDERPAVSPRQEV
ncbi:MULTISPECIES: hypothetical protein [Rhizobium]|uniref:Uncharacterized protein n=1 Tax=Rhizobium leguminosarum bv. trifolii (strain WSM1325) TaxID=395491 RepID=C6B7K5_RHILS|nr:hypothetical protein [Rhizobium leguminosarum]ACS60063.1 hypothetical protein Rleg_7052 [Rhizobium leguminosarum bv. trifolii WSM1325]